MSKNGNEDQPTIDLSSDEETPNVGEEEEDDGVELVTIRPMAKSQLIDHDARPPPSPETKEQIAEVDELENGGADLNMEPKTGHIKELIDSKGLGMIYSEQRGLVLFHVSTCWKDGELIGDKHGWKTALEPGTEVNFLDQFHEGPEFNCVSPEGFLRQAVAVWLGARPGHLLKKIREDKQQFDSNLKRHRQRFLDLINGNKFMHVPVVRAKGHITGYLTPDIGLIESDNCVTGKTVMVVFYSKDVYVYKKKVEGPVEEVVPVGLRVYLDAREVCPFRNVSYQACHVFAGSWPEVPHPTAFPNGPASRTPQYNIEAGRPDSFYYLDLAMEDRLNSSLDKFCRHADEKGTALRKSRFTVDTFQECVEWQKRYSPFNKISMRKREHKERYHEFKKDDPEEKKVKTEVKEEDGVKKEKA